MKKYVFGLVAARLLLRHPHAVVAPVRRQYLDLDRRVLEGLADDKRCDIR